MARIVYLSPSTLPSRAANSVHVMRMCAALARNGHQVDVIAAHPSPSEVAVDGDDIFRFYSIAPSFAITRFRRHSSIIGSAWYWLQVARHCQTSDPDLVFSRDIVAASLVANRARSLILELHELSAIRRRPLYRWAFTTVIHSKSFRRLVVISSVLAEDVLASFPELHGRVLIAHDAADPVALTARPIVSATLPATLRAGYIGNLYGGRGLALMTELAERLPWVNFEVVGSIGDGITAQAERFWKLPNVKLHGHLPFSDAERIRLSCDVLLAPYENSVMTHGGVDTSMWMSPLKIFEYMAAGKPILCSDLPVLREILADEQSALLVPANDPVRWCEALLRLRDNPKLRESLGEAAKRRFVAEYTWDGRAQKVLANLWTDLG